jgi:organic radical activating enzyme
MLIDEVNKFFPNYKCDLVITGGEPLLYWNNQQFQEFLKYYINKNIFITIETNASIDIDLLPIHKNILFSMSVKLSNTLEKEDKRININTINKILSNAQGYLKFVLDKNFLPKADIEIKNLLSQIKHCDIYVMPKGDNKKELENNSIDVFNFAIKYGYKYSDRIHIRLFDNKTGV